VFDVERGRSNAVVPKAIITVVQIAMDLVPITASSIEYGISSFVAFVSQDPHTDPDQVTSTPVAWREGSNSMEYPYDAGMGRQFQCRTMSNAGIYGTVPSYTPSSGLMPQNIYRTQSFPDYPYNKPSTYLSGSYGNGNDYDDSVDYSLSSGPYPMLSHEPLNGYPTRGWTPGPQKPQSTMYFDSDGGASNVNYHSQMYQPNPYTQSLRSSISTAPIQEPNAFSFGSMASSLPTPAPLTSNDRLLPMPATAPVHRNSQGLISLSRTAEGLPYASPTSNHGLKIPGGGQSVASNTLYQMPTPLSDSPDNNSYQNGPAHNGAEIYGGSSPPGGWPGHEPSGRHGSQGELYYTTGSSSASHFTDGSGRKMSRGSAGHTSQGMLQNGNSYGVQYAEEREGLELGEHDVGVAHRGSNGNLRS
jgi:hypothetical protein